MPLDSIQSIHECYVLLLLLEPIHTKNEKKNNEYTKADYSIQTYREKLRKPLELLHEIVTVHVIIYPIWCYVDTILRCKETQLNKLN
jgi:hypothetical protein